MQKRPELNLIGSEDLSCNKCAEETTFTVRGDGAFAGKFLCKSCFIAHSPEYTDAIVDFAALVEMLAEEHASKMTLEDMHALYGNNEEE